MRIASAGCVALVAFAACSDATSSSHALRAEALHFDSLATLAEGHASLAHLINLQVIANGFAHGAEPGVVTMTIGGTPVSVHVIGIQAVDSNPADGRVYVAGWIDADADTTISVDVRQFTTGFVVDNVSLAIGDSSASTQTFQSQYPFMVKNSNATCANYPITNQINTMALPCHLGQGTVSFTADVTADGVSQFPVPVATLIVSPSVTFGLAQFDGL